MGRHPLENALARAVWLLADMRKQLSSFSDLQSKALVHRCDTYFSETYRSLRVMTSGDAPTSSASAQPAGEPGADSMVGGGSTSPSEESVGKSNPPPTSEVPFSPSFNGGGPSTPTGYSAYF